MWQMVQMKDLVSAVLMETGVGHNKHQRHKVGYFRELVSANAGVHPSILPLLKLSRETIERLSSRVEKLNRSLSGRLQTRAKWTKL